MSRFSPRICTFSTRRGGGNMYEIVVLSLIDVIFNNITWTIAGAFGTLMLLLILFKD